MKKRTKKAQIRLSFGMIFSIMLIIIFILFAFFAIKKFLDWRDTVQIGLFINDLQDQVDNAWRSTQTSQKFSNKLPSNIDYVCFIDFNSEANNHVEIYDELYPMFFGERRNIFFYPIESSEGFEGLNIDHLNLEGTTEIENPLCIPVIDGKISFYVKKNYGEKLVRISKT